MSLKDEKIALVEFLRLIAPAVDSNIRKEIVELEKLLTAFGATSIRELSGPILKERDKWRKSPEGFAARIADFLAAQDAGTEAAETVETLVADFAKATGTTVKAVAKKFGIELADKSDAPDFERWLRTGVKPPTLEEKLRDQIAPEIDLALELRDQTRRELASATIDQMMVVAERVKTTFKLPGLALFMRGIDCVPTSKTAAAAIKELRLFLEDFALNRLKATQIREM